YRSAAALTAPASAPRYPLSLHDALPIFDLLQAAGLFLRRGGDLFGDQGQALDLTGDPLQRLAGIADQGHARPDLAAGFRNQRLRSEEHTSELQSRENLVCRLLLEKKNET